MLGFGSQKRAGIQNMLYKQKKHELCWRWSLVTVTLHNRMLYFNRGRRKPSQAASCTINPPLETSTGSDLGFIMIPGAQVPTSFQAHPNCCKKTLRFLGSNMLHWLQRYKNTSLEFVSGPVSPPAGSETSRTRSRSQEPWTTV